ncbi:hypothetical protein [uncultured Dokdonia sp.]|uniref:hypothetical protein n=1 Tax=uncultured Dokdonia sp. TaxID=575653 RepID=UPI002608D4B2|nr:hypothetical protein [uncultured Dokdonia sp.]
MRLLKNILVFIGCVVFTSCTSSLADTYGKEISSLRTQEEIDAYWKELERIDQEILVGKEHTTAVYDSISISNMIRVALLFEVPEKESFHQKGPVPVVALSHNFNKDAAIAYWPVIVKCAEKGGAIDQIGYPSYPLEAISMTFYGYSLFDQDERYSDLVRKLNKSSGGFVLSQLELAFKKEKRLQSLTETKSIGVWHIEATKNEKSKEVFEFVQMSDDAIYKKSKGRIQKLVVSKTTDTAIIYKIENEPFDWYYQLEETGDLILFDQHDKELIAYTKVN